MTQLTTTDLVAKLAEKTGSTKVDAKATLQNVIDLLVESLTEAESVRIQGLGTFKVVETAARKGRNPITGGELDIPASKRLSFKATTSLKNAIRGVAAE